MAIPERTYNPVRISFDRETGRTKQAHKDECDINNIVNHWRRTRQLSHLNQGKPWYGDFTNAIDYQEACDRIALAEQKFLELPAKVRKLCDNSPALLLEELESEEGRARLEEAGFVFGEEAAQGTPQSPQGESVEEPTPAEGQPAEGP